MNVIIGWILLVIVMSTFITFAFGYDLDLKDKIMCVVGTDAFVFFACGWCIPNSRVEQEAQLWK